MVEYKNIIIYYFSGTGNSKRIASWIQEFATNKGMGCHLINISDASFMQSSEPSTDNLIIIISPIHGFNYPKITLDFIRHFPKGSNNVILMNTRAGMKIGNMATPGLTGIAFLLSSVILKAKGYKIAGLIPFDMPSNWLSIHPALSHKAVIFLHRKNYIRTKKYCDKIFSGQPAFIAYKDIVQDILIFPVSLAYYIAGRFFLAKSFYASIDCDNCGLCIKECPVKAIKMVHNRPFWKLNCESCMRCMAHCPHRAIETAHGLFVIISILCSMIGSYLFYILLPIHLQSTLIKIVLYNVLFLILLWFFYTIQHLLLRNKYIGRIISLTSLTHYKFWGRYKSISDKIWKKK